MEEEERRKDSAEERGEDKKFVEPKQARLVGNQENGDRDET